MKVAYVHDDGFFAVQDMGAAWIDGAEISFCLAAVVGRLLLLTIKR